MIFDDLKSFEFFFVYLQMASFLAGCFGVCVTLAVRRFCIFVDSKIARHAAQVYMDRVIGKVGEP